MKLFCISDTHGHYQEMINALGEAGFDENNPEHLLIHCGDMFDRGEESLNIYLYLKRLNDKGKAIVIKGNHEPMFTDYLNGKCKNMFNFLYNGTSKTIDDFYHSTNSFGMYYLEHPEYLYREEAFVHYIAKVSNEINEEYPELLSWLENLPYYYETKNYIFAHGAIDLNAKDWHYPECTHHDFKGWEALTWNDGSFICHKNTSGKNIVVGHFDSGHLRHMWQIDSKDPDDHSILKTEDGMYFIDGCVPVTKKVNILVVEDELIDNAK